MLKIDNKPMNPNEVHFISCPIESRSVCEPPKKFERAEKVDLDGYPGKWARFFFQVFLYNDFS